MCYTRCTTKLLVQLDVLCIVAAKQQECTSIYYVIIGGRFAPLYLKENYGKVDLFGSFRVE